MILFLFKPQILIKLFDIINTVDHMYILIRCNCIYIYNEIAVYSVSGKANLHIDITNVILINMCLVLLISNCLIYLNEYEQKISVINLKRNPLTIINN